MVVIAPVDGGAPECDISNCSAGDSDSRLMNGATIHSTKKPFSELLYPPAKCDNGLSHGLSSIKLAREFASEKTLDISVN